MIENKATNMWNWFWQLLCGCDSNQYKYYLKILSTPYQMFIGAKCLACRGNGKICATTSIEIDYFGNQIGYQWISWIQLKATTKNHMSMEKTKYYWRAHTLCRQIKSWTKRMLVSEGCKKKIQLKFSNIGFYFSWHFSSWRWYSLCYFFVSFH